MTDVSDTAPRTAEARAHDDVRVGLDVWYQPIFDVVDDRVVAVEALARTGDESHIDERLLDQVDLLADVVDQITADADQLGDVAVSVNLSEHDLVADATTERVVALVEAFGTGRVAVEVSELFAPFDPAALRLFDRLAATGVDLVLDQFGAGMTTTAIRSQDFGGVKLDRALLVDRRAGALGVAEALAAFAANLGLEVTAVGVESPAVVASLGDAGVRRFQGHMFAKAMPLEALAAHVPPI